MDNFINKLEYVHIDSMKEFLMEDMSRMSNKIENESFLKDHLIKSPEICWMIRFESFKNNYLKVRKDFMDEIRKFISENTGSVCQYIKYKDSHSFIGNTFHLEARILYPIK